MKMGKNKLMKCCCSRKAACMQCSACSAAIAIVRADCYKNFLSCQTLSLPHAHTPLCAHTRTSDCTAGPAETVSKLFVSRMSYIGTVPLADNILPAHLLCLAVVKPACLVRTRSAMPLVLTLCPQYPATRRTTRGTSPPVLPGPPQGTPHACQQSSEAISLLLSVHNTRPGGAKMLQGACLFDF